VIRVALPMSAGCNHAQELAAFASLMESSPPSPSGWSELGLELMVREAELRESACRSRASAREEMLGGSAATLMRVGRRRDSDEKASRTNDRGIARIIENHDHVFTRYVEIYRRDCECEQGSRPTNRSRRP
jgi:hypothetical protein